jgi:hypothetical protein
MKSSVGRAGKYQTARADRKGTYPTGNVSHPIALPRHDGCWRVTPFRPHRAHRAEWRSLLLEVSRPHRMINGTIAVAALCRQAGFVQWIHHQQLVLCNSCKVETVPS